MGAGEHRLHGWTHGNVLCRIVWSSSSQPSRGLFPLPLWCVVRQVVSQVFGFVSTPSQGPSSDTWNKGGAVERERWIDKAMSGWLRFVPVRFLMRFGFQGRFDSSVRFGSRGSPVRAVRRFTRFAGSRGSAHAVRPVVAKIVPKHKNRNCHENSPRESCGPLDRTTLLRISVRTFLF